MGILQQLLRTGCGIGALLMIGGCAGLSPDLPSDTESSQVKDAAAIPITADLVSQLLNSAGRVKVVHSVPPKTPFSADISERRYRVGRGDKLAIAVPALATLAPTGSTSQAYPRSSQGADAEAQGYLYTVGDDGTIYLPFAGFLKVQGLTVREVQETVIERLSQYIRSPQALVSVAQFNSQRVIVTGAVAKAGYLPITNVPLTVLDAVVASGSVKTISTSSTYPMSISGTQSQTTTLRADEPDLSNVIIRRGNSFTTVNLDIMLRTGNLTDNFVLLDGDAVQIGRLNRTNIYLLGEVNQQALVEILDQRTSLAQVLAAAGGVRQASVNAHRIYVIRGDLRQPKIYQLDGDQPEALLLADAFKLEERDVVYVAEAGISKWNRFITNLLPSIQTLLTGGVVVNATN